MRFARGPATLVVSIGLVSAAVLVACGGGGGGGGTASNGPIPPTVGLPAPSGAPSAVPSRTPSPSPSVPGSPGPKPSPSSVPSIGPSITPSIAPSITPSIVPSAAPAPVGDSSAAGTFLTDNPAILYGNSEFFNVTGAATSAPIDGIPCIGPLATLGQHFHSHLTVYVNGTQYAIPIGIGIHHPVKLYGNPNTLVGWYNIPAKGVDPAACHYDIHVHAGDGVIHVETASTTQVFTLKQFLDIWGVSFSTTGFWKFSGPTRWFETNEAVGAAGSYKVREITGADPATVLLGRHVEFTVEVGTPVVKIPNYIFVESQL